MKTSKIKAFIKSRLTLLPLVLALTLQLFNDKPVAAKLPCLFNHERNILIVVLFAIAYNVYRLIADKFFQKTDATRDYDPMSELILLGIVVIISVLLYCGVLDGVL